MRGSKSAWASGDVTTKGNVGGLWDCCPNPDVQVDTDYLKHIMISRGTSSEGQIGLNLFHCQSDNSGNITSTMFPNMPRSLLLAVAALSISSLAQLDLDTSSNVVGICYSVWHSLGYTGSTPPDITEIEQGVGTFAPQPDWHFWGRPDGGYYGGGDRGVLDRHFAQISGAGIDFIVIDGTNLQVR